jgi:hypothetical protein
MLSSRGDLESKDSLCHISCPAMSAIRLRAFTMVVLLIAGLAIQPLKGDVCVYKPPKVRRICGVIVGDDGRPIPNVKVSVLKEETTVKTTTADDTGEFDFDGIAAGKYEFDADIAGFQHARYQLTLSRPTNSCTHGLRVEMIIAGIHCGGDIRVTNRPVVRKR